MSPTDLPAGRLPGRLPGPLPGRLPELQPGGPRGVRVFPALLGGLYLLAVLIPYDVVGDVDPARGGLGPGLAHWLGTDHLGRDVLWRVIRSVRSFFVPGLLAAALSSLLGAAGGTLAGWSAGGDGEPRRGGLLLSDLARYVSTSISAVPRLILALLAISIFARADDSLWVLAVALGISEAPLLAEAWQARIGALQRQEFVIALRAHGVPRARILWYHLLYVHGRGLIARHAVATFGQFLILEATLSYLGRYGIPEPTPSWGNMISFSLSGSLSGYGENPLAWMAPAAMLAGSVWGTYGLATGGLATGGLATGGLATGGPGATALEIGGSGDPAAAGPAALPALIGDGLEIRGVRVLAGDQARVADGAWSVGAGEIVALVGPSGSGKSLTVRACLGLTGPGLRVAGGEVRLRWRGESLSGSLAGEPARGPGGICAELRGRWVGWIDQDARASLDPLRTVQAQVEEAAGLAGRTGEQAGAAAWLRQAGFSDPGAVLRLWPHQLSGGMAQRVAIARALARGSRFLLADECTSGLDAVIVEELLTELRRLRAAGFGVLLVTHDLRLARRVADRVILLHEGRTVEQADAPERLTGVGRELWAATCRVGPGTAAPGEIA